VAAAVPSIEKALSLHRSGDLEGARSLYQKILDRRPNDAMARHYLGVIAHQTGRRDEALQWMRQSITAAPGVADFHCNLGVLLRDCGRLDEAAAALRRAIQLRGNYPEALNNLGDVLRQQGKLAEAADALRQSIAVRPSAEALLNLGLILIDQQEYAGAIAALIDCLRHNPKDHIAGKSLATALRLAGRSAEAVEISRVAVAAEPRDADAFFGLGNGLREINDMRGAAAAYQRALELSPDQPDVLEALAATMFDLGEVDAAIQIGGRAVGVRPASAEARYNLSLALLAGGRMEEGWKLYESRWQCPAFGKTLAPLGQPAWDGSDPAGKTILVRAEQGCGDTIQFSRYVPMLAERGAKVILECQAEVKPLLAGLSGGATIIARGEEPPPFDCHLPLLSVPMYFKTTLETIPSDVPYLRADPARVGTWRARLSGIKEFKCGLVWAGSRHHRNDRNRSIPVSALAPLADIKGVKFVSLQVPSADAAQSIEPQRSRRPDRLSAISAVKADFPISGVLDFGTDLHTFADTAALLMQLDLLISVDTAAVHLAGALGRPVWTLLPYAADWRWMSRTETTPWYPTMRLFRQPARGDWATVIAAAALELKAILASNHGGPDGAEPG
jgi:tetratricopeptide (TPR) repeat protein